MPNIYLSRFSIHYHGVDDVMLKTATKAEDNTSSNCSCARAAPSTTSMSPVQLPSGVVDNLIPLLVMANSLLNSNKEEPIGRKIEKDGGR